MKKVIYLLFTVIFAITFSSCGGNSKKSADDGWVTIFDGKSFKGWRGYTKEGVPEQWTIESDGSMKINGNEERKTLGLDLLWDEKLKNFEFEMEWKAPERGNSGLFYYAQEVPGMAIYNSATEVALGSTDGSGRITKTGPGSAFDIKAAEPQNAKVPGEWNKIKIIVNKGTVTHIQNDVEVCKYTLWTEEWKELLNNSKFSEERSPRAYSYLINIGGDNREGYIGLQEHGTDFWFRNIRLKKLP